MTLSVSLFAFIPFLILCLYFISKIADHFQVYPRTTIILMILTVILTGFAYTYYRFYDVNRDPPNGEFYRMESANFNIFFQNDGSANIEHLIMLHQNRSSFNSAERIINYVFKESGEISNLKVWLNTQPIKSSPSNELMTYQANLNTEKNTVTIYPPNLKNDDIELKVTYSTKNGLKHYNSVLGVYYNTFLSERSGFSYNTNTKGTISFHLPQDSLLESAASSKNLYVIEKQKSRNNVVFYFENKFPYEDSPFSMWTDCVRVYDPIIRQSKRYLHDFSLTARVDFISPSSIEGSSSTSLGDDIRSISELKIASEQTNKEYSDIRFLWGCFIVSLYKNSRGFLIFSFLFIYSYYKRNEYEI